MIKLIIGLIIGFILGIIFFYYYFLYEIRQLSFLETCNIMGGTTNNNNCIIPNWIEKCTE